MKLRTHLWSLVIGLIAGALGMVTHAGPVDGPVIGLCVASLIVMCGAWLVLEMGDRISWLIYIIAVTGITLWLTYAPPAGDVLYSDSRWASEWWVILAPLVSIIVALIGAFAHRRSRTPRDTADK